MSDTFPRWPAAQYSTFPPPPLGPRDTFYLGQHLVLPWNGPAAAAPVYTQGEHLMVTGYHQPFERLVMPQTLVSLARFECCVGIGFCRRESLQRLKLAGQCGRSHALLIPAVLSAVDRRWLERLLQSLPALQVYRVDLQGEAGSLPPGLPLPLGPQDCWLDADLVEVIVPDSGCSAQDARAYQALERHVGERLILSRSSVNPALLTPLFLHLHLTPERLGAGLTPRSSIFRTSRIHLVVLIDSPAAFGGEGQRYLQALRANSFDHQLYLLSGMAPADLRDLPGGFLGQDALPVGERPWVGPKELMTWAAEFGPNAVLRQSARVNQEALQALPLDVSHFPPANGRPPVVQALFRLHLSAQMHGAGLPAPRG